MLVMEDEAGEDEKVLSVPVDALHPYYSNVSSYRGLPQILLDQIAHFFAHYKDLERNKWVEIKHWAEADEACRMIEAAIRAATAGPKGKYVPGCTTCPARSPRYTGAPSPLPPPPPLRP